MTNIFSRGTSLAIIASMLLTPIAAQAQSVPGGSVNTASSASGSAPVTTGDLGYVMLADVRGPEPREALPGNIGPNTPILTKAQYMNRFPAAGEAGWQRARRANNILCDEAQGILDDVFSLQGDFASLDQDYLDLQQIYDALPGKMKKHAKIQVATTVIATGGLCALTLGLYCIAAVANGVGNIAGIHGNLKMQLLSIQASAINVRHARVTVKADQVWGRATTLWVRAAMPGCALVNPGYGIPAGMNTGRVYPLQPTPANRVYDNGVQQPAGRAGSW